MDNHLSEQELIDIENSRDYLVIKGNEIIQKARYDLSLQEQKLLAYCISQIKPNDSTSTVYTVSIPDFCKVCGIDYNNGKNYASVKSTVLSLVKQAFWILEPDGSEVTVHWLEKVRINRGNGKIKIRFDEDLKKYIHGLFRNFTQYELLAVLPMKSHYSFRIYELLKSYAYTKKHRFEIDELKRLLMAEIYVNFKDFRVKVIEPSIREINAYTDLKVEWEPETKGRKVIAITFYMIKLDGFNYGINRQKARAELNRQLTIFDFIPEDEGKGEA